MARSFLYTPADRPDRLQGAGRTGADAVIADLEDGVAPSAKEGARVNVAAWLEGEHPGPARYVRVNAGPLLDADISALGDAMPDGIVLPKATIESIGHLGQLLRERSGAEAVVVTALVESAVGLLELPALAAHPLVTHLSLGEADLVADLGVDPSADGRELWPLRSQVVVASAAAGIEPPVGPVETDFRDLDGLAETTEALRRAGYGARAAIHPGQVPVINDAFTPGREQVVAARELVARLDQASAEGDGVAIDEGGRMIDEAVVRRARRTLDAHAELGDDAP